MTTLITADFPVNTLCEVRTAVQWMRKINMSKLIWQQPIAGCPFRLFEDCYNQKQCCVSTVRTGKHMTKHQLVLTFLLAGEVPFVLHKRETILPPIIHVSHFAKNVYERAATSTPLLVIQCDADASGRAGPAGATSKRTVIPPRSHELISQP